MILFVQVASGVFFSNKSMFLDCLFPCCFGNNNLSKTTIQPKTRPRNTVPSTSNHGHIADKWRLLMGETQWETLLDPLDIDLRRAIVHYGEMAQATYDTFIDDEYSRYTGGSKYSKTNFLAKLGLEYGHPYRYRVTKFIHATSEIDVPSAFILNSSALEPRLKDSNFIVYIAVAEDESVKLLGRRDIVVTWRGTIQLLEWVNDFKVSQVSATSMLGNEGEDEPMVHQGWLSIYTSSAPSSPFENTSARDQVLTELRKLVEQYKNEEISITVTGHSLGAALATLNAVDIVANKINQPENSQKDVKPCLVTAIVFASPSVGDENFKRKMTQYDELRVLRVTNASDIVPSKPSLGYCDVGEELKIDTTTSPYLKDSAGSPSSYHNLEVYLHGVAGTQGNTSNENGSTTTFELVVERDVALVNKGLDILKDDYLIPESWWVLKNKGMAQESDGFWLLKDHESDEDYDA